MLLFCCEDELIAGELGMAAAVELVADETACCEVEANGDDELIAMELDWACCEDVIPLAELEATFWLENVCDGLEMLLLELLATRWAEYAGSLDGLEPLTEL